MDISSLRKNALKSVSKLEEFVETFSGVRS